MTDIEVSPGDTLHTDTAGKDALPTRAEKGPKLPDLSVPGPIPGGATSQRGRCAHISASGASCGAWAVKNSPYCFYHDDRPDAIAKRERSRAKGNKKSNSKDGLENWIAHPIGTLSELQQALSELFNAGMAGDISTTRLTALATVGNALNKAIEGSDLESRIAALEQRLEAKK